MSTIAFGGSRKFGQNEIIAKTVHMCVNAGHSISIGCAVGADATVITSCLSALELHRLPHDRLNIYTIGFWHEGWWKDSAVELIVNIAKINRVNIHWEAGGSISEPVIKRLKARSKAQVDACDCFVAFVGNHQSRGTINTAKYAARVGKKVYAYGKNLPPLGDGSWTKPITKANSGLVGFRSWIPIF